MSWHRQYRGQSLGRVLHFLYHYCGFDVAEMAMVENDYVSYHGSKIATFTFLPGEDIPVFTFLNASNTCYDKERWDRRKEMYEENQRTKLLDALKDQDAAKPEPCKECRNLKLELSIYKTGMNK